jgi:hypothetical protein
MRTNFDKVCKHVLKVAHEKLGFTGYSLFIKSWQDDTFELEIRVSAEGRIHRFMYEKSNNYITLFHRIIEKAKIDFGFENFGVHPKDVIEIILDYKEL